MKKIVLLLALVMFVANAYSQETLNSDYYLQKSKDQKTAAWIFFGVGTTTTITGMLAMNLWDGNFDPWANITLVGIVVDLVSIPLFISAKKNKKKAASLSISHQNIYQLQGNSFSFNQTPALTLRVRF